MCIGLGRGWLTILSISIKSYRMFRSSFWGCIRKWVILNFLHMDLSIRRNLIKLNKLLKFITRVEILPPFRGLFRTVCLRINLLVSRIWEKSKLCLIRFKVFSFTSMMLTLAWGINGTSSTRYRYLFIYLALFWYINFCSYYIASANQSCLGTHPSIHIWCFSEFIGSVVVLQSTVEKNREPSLLLFEFLFDSNINISIFR